MGRERAELKEKRTLFLSYGSAERIVFKSFSADPRNNLSILPRTERVAPLHFSDF